MLRGWCFAFRSQTHFLTAAHCVAELDPDQLAVAVPEVQPIRLVRQVHLHPTADAAIVEVVGEPAPVEPFAGYPSTLSLGEDFLAFGYREDLHDPYPVARDWLQTRMGIPRRMIEYDKKLATLATCFALALGGAGVAGCGDDDNEGVGEEAGQELEQAGDTAEQELDEAGEDIEAETDGDEGDK